MPGLALSRVWRIGTGVGFQSLFAEADAYPGGVMDSARSVILGSRVISSASDSTTQLKIADRCLTATGPKKKGCHRSAVWQPKVPNRASLGGKYWQQPRNATER